VERDFAGVRVSQEVHKELVNACGWDPRFPTHYEAWLDMVAEGTQLVVSEGRQVEELVLDVADFVTWCQRIGVRAGFDALRAYLILLRGGSDVLPGGDSDRRSSGASRHARHKKHRGASAAALPLMPPYLSARHASRVRACI
jgi:hypothetical protein